MWRVARPEDDERIVAMCLAFYREDPPVRPVSADQVRSTLARLRAEPARGRAVVCEIDGRIVGYSLLISFWSNEYGGAICDVDELFVEPGSRSRGYGRALFEAVERGGIWPEAVVGIALVVTPRNELARRLYERIGFAAGGTMMGRFVGRDGARGA